MIEPSGFAVILQAPHCKHAHLFRPTAFTQPAVLSTCLYQQATAVADGPARRNRAVDRA